MNASIAFRLDHQMRGEYLSYWSLGRYYLILGRMHPNQIQVLPIRAARPIRSF